MKTIKEIRNEIAIKHGGPNWDDYLTYLLRSVTCHQMITIMTDEIAEEYRKQGRYYSEDEIRVIQEQAYDEGLKVDRSDL